MNATTMNEQGKTHIQASNKDYPCHVSYNKRRRGNAIMMIIIIIIILCVPLTRLAFMMTTGEPKDELARGSAAIVELDFIIRCFLPAEVELTSQALNAWGGIPTPPCPSPSASDSQLPYKLHHQIMNLDTVSCNNISG
jgi:hypothetical protein